MYFVSAEIEEDLKCAFCKEKFQDVVKLVPDCGESICGRCYEELRTSLATRSKKFNCRCCYESHSLPVDGFPDNRGFSRMLKRRKVEKALNEQAKELKTSIESVREKLGGLESFDAASHINKTCDQLMFQVCQATTNEIKLLREVEERLLKQIKEYRAWCLESSSTSTATSSASSQVQTSRLGGELDALLSDVKSFSRRWEDYFNRADLAASDSEIEKALGVVKGYEAKMQSLERRLKLDVLNNQVMVFETVPGDRASYENKYRLYIKEANPNEIKIRETPSSTLCGHLDFVNQALFLPDGKLVSCSKDNTIKVWNAQILEFELVGHAASINTLAVVANGWLASGSDDKTIKIWNLEQRAELRTLRGHSRPVVSLRALRNNKLASYSTDNTIRIWRLNSAVDSPIITMEGHGNVKWLIQIGVLSNENLVTCSCDAECIDESTLRVWDSNAGRLVNSVPTELNAACSLLVLFNDQVALGYINGTIKVVDLTDSSKWRTRENAHQVNVLSLAQFSNDNLVSSAYDGVAPSHNFTIKTWNLSDLSLLQCVVTDHVDPVQSLCISPDERFLATTSRDKTIKLWQTSL